MRKKKMQGVKMQPVNEELETINNEVDLAKKELEKTKSELEAKRAELKSQKLREYDKDEDSIVDKQINSACSKSSLKKKIDAQKAYDNQRVTGKFLNQRNPGQAIKLTYIKYAEDEVKWYTLEHNKVYTIPRGFADQINEHYAKIVYGQKSDNVIIDPNNPGTALESTPIKHQIYSFVPVNF